MIALLSRCKPSSRTLFVLLLFAGSGIAGAVDYSSPGPSPVSDRDFTWHDASRNRDLPIRVYTPSAASSSPLPVVLFSHGLGGSRRAGENWGRHWASHGYLCLHLQHPGSDESLLRGDRKLLLRPREALKKGMNAEQALERVRDVHFALDELTRRQRAGEAPFVRADLARIGLAGHSFGARTTQAVAGERLSSGFRARDERIRAAIAFSPSAGGTSGEWHERFGSIAIPYFSITGKRDEDGMGIGSTPQNRRAPFDNMPPHDKYLLVIGNARHSSFGGRSGGILGASEREAMLAKAASTAFWDAYLKGERNALAWLAQGSFAHLLGKEDLFEQK